MRKLSVSAVGAAVIAAVLAAAVIAAGGTRLEGKFKMTGTVQSTDITGLSPGDQVKDTYTFKPTCNKGPCDTIKLTRDSGGRNVKSTLKRKKGETYKGTEGPAAYTCLSPLADPGHFTGTNVVKVVKSHKGSATKISATSKVKITGCDETFENSKLTGTRK